MFYDLAKRLLDLLAALTLIVLFVPVWIIVPLLIKLDSPGPIFFLQKRLGKNSRVFKIIKFRTMRTDAEEYWKNHPKLYQKFKKQSWKLTLDEDPRVTKLGRVLRQTSIDEFPQVFNVLLGSMSLIGPRPIRDIEAKDAIRRYGKKIKEQIDTSLTVKPGISGPWQVSGRNDIPWDKRLKIDAQYASRRNLLDDLRIILKTPLAMISKW